jgi:hypothetical protein
MRLIEPEAKSPVIVSTCSLTSENVPPVIEQPAMLR